MAEPFFRPPGSRVPVRKRVFPLVDKKPDGLEPLLRASRLRQFLKAQGSPGLLALFRAKGKHTAGFCRLTRAREMKTDVKRRAFSRIEHFSIAGHVYSVKKGIVARGERRHDIGVRLPPQGGIVA